MRVLIADDDRDQLAIREMLLRSFGFEVLAACNHEAALEMTRKSNPSCAVLDLRLPDEAAGRQLIRDLKGFNPGIHIFVLSGTNPKRLDRLPERTLVDEVFEKGTSSSELLSRLKAVREKP